MTAIHRNISAAEYHADPAISAGKLEDFRESRRLFEARYITKTISPKEATPAMILGTNVHMRVLEPDRYRSLIAEPFPELAPDGKKWLRRKDSPHEQWWADEVAKREGKIALEKYELDLIEAIAESVLSRPWARPLLREDGEPEYSIFWTDEETGLQCKCLVDWFRRICIDLKTTGDPSPIGFTKTAVRFGYHRRKSHYRAGLAALNGRETTLLHIVVSTEPPFSCGAYDLFDTGLDGKSLGDRQWRIALRKIAKCYETGDWSDPWEREIVSLSLPAWAFTEDSYQM